VDAKVKPQLRCNKSVNSYKLTDNPTLILS
jgi:hypothetical protein